MAHAPRNSDRNRVSSKPSDSCDKSDDLRFRGAEAVPGSTESRRLNPEPPALLNTAGEPEREAWSRRANLIEALLVMLLLLATLWCLAYPFGVVMAMPLARVASHILVAVLFAFVLVISPWLHRDSLNSRGLGSPKAMLRALRAAGARTPHPRVPGGQRHADEASALLQPRPAPARVALIRLLAPGGIIAAATLLALELYRNATGSERLVFAIEPAVTFDLQRALGGQTTLLALCAALALGWFTCIVRYDNLGPALRAAGRILGVLLPLALLLGWAVNGPEAFSKGKAWNLARNGLGYVFWGAVQQLVFCSYFGTRLRKGFAPASQPRRRAWKRLGVAALNGLFFGLVHINGWLLVGFAWVLGTILSWVFMEDRYRNLQALGLVHGILGTSILWLFAQTGDAVRIHLRLGPWAMPHRWDLATVAVVGNLLLGLSLALLLVARRPPHRQAE